MDADLLWNLNAHGFWYYFSPLIDKFIHRENLKADNKLTDDGFVLYQVTFSNKNH